MATHINSAHRIHRILAAAAGLHQNQTTGQVWVQVFGIDEEDETRRNFEISRCLNQLYDEIGLLENLVQATDFSMHLYKPYLDRARQAIVPHGIKTNWNSYCSNLSPDTLLSFEFWQEILPPEESAIDIADLEEIEQLLADLEKSLTSKSIPDPIRKIIEKHIFKIREALYSYNIIGIKAMNDVVQSAYGEVYQNGNLFESAKSTEPIIKLSKIWQKIKQVGDIATNVNGHMTTGAELIDKGVKAIDFIDKFMSGM